MVIGWSRLKKSVMEANRKKDPLHIDFECPTIISQIRTGYNTLLDTELILRKMYRHCTLPVEQKQKLLRLCVRNGEEVASMRSAIKRWHEKEEGRQMDVDDAILCSLHLELRCNENKIGALFNEGLTHRRGNKVIGEYTEEVEEIVNRGKIGRGSHQNQWRFPMNKEKNGVSTEFSLKGEAGKNILGHRDELIPVCLRFHSQSYRDEWDSVLAKYDELLKYMNRREEFTEEMVSTFQSMADVYADDWADLTG